VNGIVGLGSHRLLTALRAHDEGTYEHCLAVGGYAERIALATGLDAEASRVIGEVGRLHDVGKVESYEIGPGGFTFTPCGLLIGHVVLGALMLERRIASLGEGVCSDGQLA